MDTKPTKLNGEQQAVNLQEIGSIPIVGANSYPACSVRGYKINIG